MARKIRGRCRGGLLRPFVQGGAPKAASVGGCVEKLARLVALRPGRSSAIPSSEPAADGVPVARIVFAETGCQRALFGEDLKAGGVEDEYDGAEEWRQEPEPRRPAREQEHKRDVHGVARARVDAGRNERRSAFNTNRVDSCVGASESPDRDGPEGPRCNRKGIRPRPPATATRSRRAARQRRPRPSPPRSPR